MNYGLQCTLAIFRQAGVAATQKLKFYLYPIDIRGDMTSEEIQNSGSVLKKNVESEKSDPESGVQKKEVVCGLCLRNFWCCSVQL